MLMQRIITALILAPLAIWGILALPANAFSAIVAVIVLMGAWEWSRLLGWESMLMRGSYVLLTLLLIAALAWDMVFIQGQTVLVIAALWWLSVLFWLVTYPTGSDFWRKHLISRAIAGLLVLLPTWVGLVLLREQAGAPYVLVLMLLIWGADTGAYFAGRQWGRRKLAPRVSPGKSWEGVAGGAVTALGIAAVANHFLHPAMGLMAFLGLAVLTVAVSIVGDLLESMFKRIVDIKDSGGLLPGHGGILDRIDSLTAAAPVFTLALWWVSR